MSNDPPKVGTPVGQHPSAGVGKLLAAADAQSVLRQMNIEERINASEAHVIPAATKPASAYSWMKGQTDDE